MVIPLYTFFKALHLFHNFCQSISGFDFFSGRGSFALGKSLALVPSCLLEAPSVEDQLPSQVYFCVPPSRARDAWSLGHNEYITITTVLFILIIEYILKRSERYDRHRIIKKVLPNVL